MSTNPPAKRQFRSVILIPAVGVLVLATVWIGVLARLSTERVEVLQAAQAKADVLADALVQHTETTIHDVDVIALVVKLQFEKDPASVNLKALQDAGFFTRETAAQVSIVNPAGRILQSTIPYAGGVYITDRQHFAVHRTPDVPGLYISKPVLGRVSGKWTIQLTRRLETKDDNFAGVVVVSEDRRYLTRGFTDVAALGENGSAAVFLQDGSKLSDDGTGEAADKQAKGRDSRKPNWKPADQITAQRTVPGYPLHVEVSLRRSDALTPYNNMKSVYLTSTALLSFFFAIFVIAISVLVHRLFKSRDRLRVLSETDTLTALWNRYGLLARLNEELARQSCLNRLAVVYIDLGNLKQVNDTLGHEAGDQLLKKISVRLRQGLSPHTVGRFGGDEFLVIVTPDDSDADVYPATHKVIDAIIAIFETAVTLRGSVFNIRASIGVSIHACSDDGVSTLIREADEAMYAAKAQMVSTHKTIWRHYSNEMRESGRLAVENEQRLRIALSDGSLRLAFYPVRETHSNSVGGFRVGVAVLEENGDLVSVNSSLSINEENGLLGPITEFALVQICLTLSSWREDGAEPTRLSYPLDKDQFLNVDCALIVRELVRRFEFVPDEFVLEVPEIAFFDEPVLAAERAVALASTGVRLMLGTFSGGFGAFELLKNSPIRGVVIGPQSCSADILASAVGCVTHSGRTVMLESEELSAKVAPSSAVSVLESFDAHLDANAAFRLLRQVASS
ncbi:diguanylate cyclase [Paraburkholderia sediminicola]|uniref:sensor domain-containing diguanylate cyclase n=1 Tax=Paraburkholderia sediminicola TaxID=458836 RepID=UPI0038BBC8DE